MDNLPDGLEELGSREQVRDYLGDLIHALRSHKPCSDVRRDDPLWCGKISCMRLGSRWCHMHECTHYQRNCADKDCLRSQAVISHWINCTDTSCFVCSPWIRPRSLESQPKRFLNDIFGSHCFLGRIVSPIIKKNRTQPSGEKQYEFVCAEKQIKDDRYRMFAMVNAVTAATINEKLSKLQKNRSRPIASADRPCTDKPGPSGHNGEDIIPIVIETPCSSCEEV